MLKYLTLKKKFFKTLKYWLTLVGTSSPTCKTL